MGWEALYLNTTGNFNTAIGLEALYFNNGSNNTAIGSTALGLNMSGHDNIALGYNAGVNLDTGNNNIIIGNDGFGGDDRTIRIGKQGAQIATYIAGIYAAPVAGSGVSVNSAGQLGVLSSSRRFKDNIQKMEDASEVLYSLQPVTFRYKHELDPQGMPQFGLVAEEVEKVDPDLVGRDAEGKVYTVRYEAVNAMLLNEFLKEHRRVQELESTVAQQQKGMEALAAQIQELRERLDPAKPTPDVEGRETINRTSPDQGQ